MGREFINLMIHVCILMVRTPWTTQHDEPIAVALQEDVGIQRHHMSFPLEQMSYELLHVEIDIVAECSGNGPAGLMYICTVHG